MRYLSILLLLSFVLSACAASSLREELTNEGPLSVSSSNPFIASNLLLAREMDESPIIRGFVKHRGIPGALEVRSSWIGNDEFRFYYVAEKESYLLEPRGEDWIIRGPYPLPDEVRALGPKLPTQVEQKAVLNLKRPEEASPTPTPTPPPLSFEEPSTPFQDNAQPQTEDIRHKVTIRGETLRLIADWYTGDPQNAGRLGAINQLENVNVLTLGSEIRVPKYLVKNPAPLTREAVERYTARRATP